MGLSTSSLPSEVLPEIYDEEDLELFQNKDMDEQQNCALDPVNSAVTNDISSARKLAKETLQKQAEKMKITSDKLHAPAKIGDNVAIPILEADKAKGDLKNIIGVVLQARDDGFYKIGTKYGILQRVYCR